MRLFLDRGFDAVTVAEVAAAAEVSEKTVFNHFPTKAELVFDADHDLLDGLLAAVRGRPAGCSALAAVRGFFDEIAGGLGGGAPAAQRRAFRRMVAESPALLAHQRQMAARYEKGLAALLAEDTGVAAEDPEPFIAAVALIGGLRAGFEAGGRSGGRAAATNRALNLVEAGLAAYAVKAHHGNDRADHPSEEGR